MAEPITILIGKGQSGDGTNPTPPGVAADPKEPGAPNLTQKAVNTALIQAGKQVMMSGFHIWGNISGDYATVEAVEQVASIGADLLMVSKGGWVGVIAVGTKYAVGFANAIATQKKNDFEYMLGMAISGGIFLDGSRGTNG